MLDLSRLKSQLLISGLQQRDNPLFQVINQLIAQVEKLDNSITSSSSSGGGSVTNITNVTQQLLMDSGGSGEDGIPGPPGINGSDGLIGRDGQPTIFFGQDGEDGDLFPPIVGPQGNPGPTGSQGPSGYIILNLDESENEPSLIPGPAGANGSSGGGSDWDATITKTIDQTVTNNSTLQNDSELTFTPDSGASYLVELIIAYTGNDTTGDYLWAVSLPLATAQQVQGWYANISAGNASQLLNSVGRVTPDQWPTAAVTNGVQTVDNIYVFQARFTFVADATSALTYQFANAAASLGRTSTTKAGSILRYKKISV